MYMIVSTVCLLIMKFLNKNIWLNVKVFDFGLMHNFQQIFTKRFLGA